MMMGVRIDLGPVELTEDEHEYVLGAFVERRRRAENEGRRAYHLRDFLREALIAESGR